jgi:hypothetical protein
MIEGYLVAIAMEGAQLLGTSVSDRVTLIQDIESRAFFSTRKR